jgi:hypothetical protein
MFPFVSSYEMALIQNDYSSMLEGEGSDVTITYLIPVVPTAVPDPDPVYKYDRRIVSDQKPTLTARCFIQVVHERNLKILGFGLVHVGDAIFYFLDDFNLLEPIAGKPCQANSLYITDPYGGDWVPILGDVGPLKRYLSMVLGGLAVAQVVPCALKK